MEALRALALAALLTGPAAADVVYRPDDPKTAPAAVSEAALRIHAAGSSVWVTLRGGKLSLRESLPEDATGPARNDEVAVSSAAAREVFETAERSGFFQVRGRAVRPKAGETAYTLTMIWKGRTKRLSAFGRMPAAMQAVFDALEKAYGQPILAAGAGGQAPGSPP